VRADGGAGILQRAEGAVLHLTLNRPEQRNALSLAMVQALMQALHLAQGDGQTRVVVLRGAGGHFSAGADLKDMAAARGQLAEDPQALEKVNAAFGELCAAFAGTRLAVLAVLEGTVMGGGLGLACAADVCLAGESASLRLPEASLGLVPAQIAPLLVERLGYSQAKRLAVTGGRLSAREALARGLVHEVHSDGAPLEQAAARVLREVLENAPDALAQSKALLAQARFASAASLVPQAAAVFSRAALGPEGQEGVMAFLKKRKPRWAS
jgi:isohexenylglutaconyl-CoA hydratase